jgi:hypothetical protein
MALALLLGTSAWAQQQTGGAVRQRGRNPTAGAGQNRDQTTAQTETIRGVIAAITAEGEVYYDHRSNSATKSEAAFVTVVGSPTGAEAFDRGRRRADAAGTERHFGADRRRHNVYIAWLTPRTKVCEATDDTERADQNRNPNRNQGQAQIQTGKKECTLDQLEVGDHVELQFSPGEESGATAGIHQTQQMRQKHGRHRTHVGFAKEITILPTKYHDQAGTRGETRPGTRSQ